MIQLGKQVLWGSIFACAAGHAQSNIPAAQAPVAARLPVQVFATMSTKDGSVATPATSTLQAAIDKQPAQVLLLRPVKDDKLLFAVLIDISSSEASKEQPIKDAALRLFQGLSNEQSYGYLVLVNQLVLPSKRPLQPSEVQATLDRIRFYGGTALYDGIGQICTQILGISQNPDTPRRVLILLSDGDDNYSHLTFAKAEEAAEREGVAIFSLAESSSPSKGEASLKQASKDTGGREIVVNKLSEGIAPLLTAIQGQLVLSIAPSQAADQKLHSLAVKTTEKDISVSVPAHILLP
jgi:Ca-activated chloride channel homolog